MVPCDKTIGLKHLLDSDTMLESCVAFLCGIVPSYIKKKREKCHQFSSGKQPKSCLVIDASVY